MLRTGKRIVPKSGQESVWDYPRPPRLETCSKHIQVVFNGVTIADTRQAKRVLETSHPPVYYIPRADIRGQHLSEASGESYCEWKGLARYLGVVVDDRRVERAAWFYPTPTPPFASLADHVAFYAQNVDACYIDGEKVIPQPASAEFALLGT
jgi:uncharacterized protein (DUF427 family)